MNPALLRPDAQQPATATSAFVEAEAPSAARWLWPTLRVLLVVAAAFVTWFIANNWDRWSGAARYERTDDAYLSGDLTPLAAKVSGYILTTSVGDFQRVRRGQVLAVIDPVDYRAQLDQAEADSAAAAANLDDIANRKAVQRALIRQADATLQGTTADVVRYHLEAVRQRNLNGDRLAGTPQAVEQADANEKRITAQLMLDSAEVDQQRGLLASLDVQQKQLAAQLDAAKAQVLLARDNLRYTEIRSPVDGMVGQRQVHPGEFVAIGTQILDVMPLPNIWVMANYKETQMTHVRLGQSVRVTVDAFPDLVLTGHVDSWSPGTGSTFALLAPDNATGNFTKVVQRVPVKIVLDSAPALGTLVRPGMSVETSIDTGSSPAAGP